MEMTCQQAASRWGISPRRVQVYCRAGRVPGARLTGGMWLLPHSATKPLDARRMSREYPCPYWPDISVLNGRLMGLHSVQDMLAQPMDDARKRQLAGEIAYFQGDYQAVLDTLSHLSPDSPGYLCAVPVVAAARTALGDSRSLLSAHEALARLSKVHQHSQEACALIALVQGHLCVSASATSLIAPWLLSGVLDRLPLAARPMALTIRVKALLIQGQVHKAVGAAEAALALLPDKGSVVAAYLYILLAQALVFLQGEAGAGQALRLAMDILLPKGLISPLAEHIPVLMGLAEHSILQAYPQYLPAVLALHQRTINAWRDAHNTFTQEHLTTQLTRREYQAAIGVATGMSNQQSARQMGISISTLKGYLQAVYQKLHVTSRKELRAYILSGETQVHPG